MRGPMLLLLLCATSTGAFDWLCVPDTDRALGVAGPSASWPRRPQPLRIDSDVRARSLGRRSPPDAIGKWECKRLFRTNKKRVRVCRKSLELMSRCLEFGPSRRKPLFSTENVDSATKDGFLDYFLFDSHV